MFDSLTFATIPPEAEALRARVRGLIEREVLDRPITERVRSWMGVDAAFSRAMAREGLLGLTLPADYGGGGQGAFARYVVVEELLASGAPVGLHWIADRQSALVILNFGTEEQRRSYLPRICAGEAFFCIGMSEPGAGSDLASVRTRAERTDTGWRLSGQKIWTTAAHLCDYMIALVRTFGTAADRQQGLSQFIVDLKSPGVTIRGIADATGHADFNEVFFDGVELPAEALLGAEGAGWAQVNAELAFERSGPERIWSSAVLLDAWVGHVSESISPPRLRGGSSASLQVKHAPGMFQDRPGDDPTWRGAELGGSSPEGKKEGPPPTPPARAGGEQRLALIGSFMARLAALRHLSIGVTARLAAGEQPVVEASLLKDLGTSFEQEVPVAVADDLGAHPDEPVAPELRAALTTALALSPAYSLRGGTREIIRGIIARGLGLR